MTVIPLPQNAIACANAAMSNNSRTQDVINNLIVAVNDLESHINENVLSEANVKEEDAIAPPLNLSGNVEDTLTRGADLISAQTDRIYRLLEIIRSTVG